VIANAGITMRNVVRTRRREITLALTRVMIRRQQHPVSNSQKFRALARGRD